MTKSDDRNDTPAQLALDARAPAQGSAPGVRFAGSRPRGRVLTLEWPIEVDGRTIPELVLRRLTGAEMADLQDLMESLTTAGKFDDSALFALVADQPPDVIRALDEDDWLALREAALDFLPRRFREAVGSTSGQPGA
jgi:hypothetical protein